MLYTNIQMNYSDYLIESAYNTIDYHESISNSYRGDNSTEDNNYYLDLLSLLEEAGYLDNKEDLLTLAEVAIELTEARVPWDNPDHPLQSGWTPAEKNRSKRKRTGVDDPDAKPIESDYKRYGDLKRADELHTSLEQVRQKRKQEKQSKPKFGLFGKKKKETKDDDEEQSHQYRTNTGINRREYGARQETDSKGYVKKWSSKTSKSASPIDVEDTRERARGSGPNPPKYHTMNKDELTSKQKQYKKNQEEAAKQRKKTLKQRKEEQAIKRINNMF